MFNRYRRLFAASVTLVLVVSMVLSQATTASAAVNANSYYKIILTAFKYFTGDGGSYLEYDPAGSLGTGFNYRMHLSGQDAQNLWNLGAGAAAAAYGAAVYTACNGNPICAPFAIDVARVTSSVIKKAATDWLKSQLANPDGSVDFWFNGPDATNIANGGSGWVYNSGVGWFLVAQCNCWVQGDPSVKNPRSDPNPAPPVPLPPTGPGFPVPGRS